MPVLRTLEENQHRDDGEESAEPMVGCIETAEQDEAEGESGGQSDEDAAQYFCGSKGHQENGGCGETYHQEVRYPEAQTEVTEEEGIDEVCSWCDELEVIAVGHLACDDSGSVACEEHLIVPGH